MKSEKRRGNQLLKYKAKSKEKKRKKGKKNFSFLNFFTLFGQLKCLFLLSF